MLEMFDEFGVDPDKVSESGTSLRRERPRIQVRHSVAQHFYFIYVSIDGSRTMQHSLKICLPPRKVAALPTSTDRTTSSTERR